MQLTLSYILGKFLRIFPKHLTIGVLDMQATFFVPVNCHYIAHDLRELASNKREPRLYEWLNSLADNSVYFDIGTSYGQEAALASSFLDRQITVIGFDCNLLHSHFCSLNKALNQDSFRFIFAAVGAESGKRVKITTNSDTHIPHLHKKNVPYSYEVMTLALDDFVACDGLHPTHMKIDVDGAEASVLEGAKSLLTSPWLQEVFIEIDNENIEIIDTMKAYGFVVTWSVKKAQNQDVLFARH